MDPIKKRKKDFIEIRYNTRKKGKFDKRITIISNAQNGEVVLKIKGKVLFTVQRFDSAPLKKQSILNTK